MSVNNKTYQIKIESILGGQSPLTHFARPDQFLVSLGIDPSLPTEDTRTVQSFKGTGLIRPTTVTKISGTSVTNTPLWIISNPKTTDPTSFTNGAYFIYDAVGSAYVSSISSTTALLDKGHLSGSSGNGCAYYDNYIYFAKDTTVARYGPLNGTPAFDPDYWVSTLGKTQLSNTTYPLSNNLVNRYPNHVMHRHSDGKLYFADVVDNQGVIHYIATNKTSVEGDTDNNSTYSKLQFGQGLWPTAIESYGENLVIALYEGFNGSVSSEGKLSSAKLAFWDTTSQGFNKIIFIEFPDQIITALKNINGVLYIFSGNYLQYGFRASRFVGGYTVEEVGYFEDGEPPFPGAIDGRANNLLIGSFATSPANVGCVYSLGLQKSSLGQGLFNILRASANNSQVKSLIITGGSFGGYNSGPMIGWTKSGTSGGTNNGIDVPGTNYGNSSSVWWSQIYKIGQSFKIKKIRVGLVSSAQVIGVGANTIITPKIYTDDGRGTSYTLATINSTNYPIGTKKVIFKSAANGEVITGDNNFFLEFVFTGSEVSGINLPITIDYELIEE